MKSRALPSKLLLNHFREAHLENLTKTVLFSTILMLSGVVVAAEKAPTVTTEETFKKVTSKDVAAWLKQNPMQIHIFDANSDSTRAKDGIIQGAKLLATSSGYIIAQTLPKDKSARLIFYCANEQCTASHSAAKRALEAGYKDVLVMTDGIEGWKKAGQPTEPVTAGKQKS